MSSNEYKLAQKSGPVLSVDNNHMYSQSVMD